MNCTWWWRRSSWATPGRRGSSTTATSRGGRTAGLADELHLVIAPFFVGDSRARRFVEDGRFPWHPDRHAELVDVRRIDDVVLLRYALSQRFQWD